MEACNGAVVLPKQKSRIHMNRASLEVRAPCLDMLTQRQILCEFAIA